MTSLLLVCCAAMAADGSPFPGSVEGGYNLPNGWRITPIGETIDTEDLLLNIQPSPDGKVMIAQHGGYNPHGVVVVDAKTNEAVQRIVLPTAWYGLAWRPDGTKLYVSGGNNKTKEGVRAPVYEFDYRDGKLSEAPIRNLMETVEPEQIYWAGLAHHPSGDILYAANRTAGDVVVFNTSSGEIVKRIKTEINPCDLILSADAKTLYCSNWASDSVSVINTETLEIIATIGVGDNPSDMVLHADGRMFVCCANDNTVVVIDTKENRAIGTIVTSMYPNAPEGSTPNAVALDPEGETLYVANADNNNICVVDVEERGESEVLGFIPAGWYPSSVGVSADGTKLYIGNAKGNGSYSNVRGPHSPLPEGDEGKGTVKTLMKGSINTIEIAGYKAKLRELTEQVYANCPYNDTLLSQARPTEHASVVPKTVGAISPIKHVIYIIKENRTYDQVLGDIEKGNGDARIAIFGREVTPNHHAIAEQFVLLDNLYCDAEVSVDGHQWSNAAYATDFTEKLWPAGYGGKSDAPRTAAVLPGAGYLWDQCARKGLTYRNYGEFARRQSENEPMTPVTEATALQGHVCPTYLSWGARDTANAAEFIKEFDEYEKNYDSTDPAKRLPNLIVMALPEDHTKGTRPGEFTPRAMVASNDYALGMILDRVSHSRYWPELALFTIQDDAQDGADHVDARRTVGIVASPYVRRGTVDSTLYTTSSMLRTIELILGLQPMSQFDAAATPMYASLGDTADPTPFVHLKPTIDIEEKNLATAWGARESAEMDFEEYDRTPMFALNEIVWKSVKGGDSEMPLPVYRFQFSAKQ